MRSLLLIWLLFLSIHVFGQADSTTLPSKDSMSLQQALDSANDYMQQLRQKEWEDRNLAGLNQLMAEQEERRKKEKTRGMIRIGIGVLFLAILVIGLRRRSKKNLS